MESTASRQPYAIRDLSILELTPEAFAPFGAVIAPTGDARPYGEGDARLDLSGGVPRFYAMRIASRGLLVEEITRHVRTTQVLASAGGHAWFIAVAQPGQLEAGNAAPEIGSIRAFRIPGDTAIMLYKGTWHAGPRFEGNPQSFFNLELADTNIADHDTCNLTARYGSALRLRA